MLSICVEIAHQYFAASHSLGQVKFRQKRQKSPPLELVEMVQNMFHASFSRRVLSPAK